MSCAPKIDNTRNFVRSIQEISSHHVLRYVLSSVVAQGRVLDAACGCGYGSRFLWEKTGNVVGVDIHYPAVEWARKHFPGPEYIVGDLTKAPWEGTFQAVVSLETLEHLPHPEVALKAFRRSCDGYLVASVPNEEFYPFRKEAFSGDQYPHQRHYTPRQFEELLTSTGWNVIGRYAQTNKEDCIPKEGTDGMFLTYLCQ